MRQEMMASQNAVVSAGPHANNPHLAPDNHTKPHHSIFTGRMLFLAPNQQCQSTEAKTQIHTNIKKKVRFSRLLQTPKLENEQALFLQPPIIRGHI